MSSCSALKRLAVLGLFAGIVAGVSAQNVYSPQGGEYRVGGILPGDQVFPSIALGTNGGYMVWQDNVTDGDGLGISAQRININQLGSFGVFRVNEKETGDQQLPGVALLTNGGAAFVWQSGSNPSQIYARFLKPDGTFVTGDLLVNSSSGGDKIHPAIASLSDGGAVIVWSSYGQDGDHLGIFGQRFSSDAARVGPEFQINQYYQYNQRTPTVAGFKRGGFQVVWISEKLRTTAYSVDPNGLSAPDGSSGLTIYDVDAYSRIFDAAGIPIGDEFKVNTSSRVCANPTLSVSADDGILVAWSGKIDQTSSGGKRSPEGWDIFGRTFGSDHKPNGPEARINSYTYGDQFRPQAASLGQTHLVVWTSLAQDGSREGVFGQFLSSTTVPIGQEIRVNTTTVSQQIFPAVASDGTQQAVVVWSSFVGGMASFDLFAQRYSMKESLPVPAAPFVSALNQSRLSVTWPALEGFQVHHYDVYMDGSSSAESVTGNVWTAAGLVAGSTHSFQVAYQLVDGRRSSLSEPSTGTTWAEDENLDGLPDDWQGRYWGPDPSQWPAPAADSDGDGATNLQEFLAGTDPTDPASVLGVQIVTTAQGARLGWNSRAGFIYQVQVSQGLGGAAWSNLDGPRFAVGATDSILLTGKDGATAFYRVLRLR